MKKNIYEVISFACTVFSSAYLSESRAQGILNSKTGVQRFSVPSCSDTIFTKNQVHSMWIRESYSLHYRSYLYLTCSNPTEGKRAYVAKRFSCICGKFKDREKRTDGKRGSSLPLTSLPGLLESHLYVEHLHNRVKSRASPFLYMYFSFRDLLPEYHKFTRITIASQDVEYSKPWSVLRSESSQRRASVSLHGTFTHLADVPSAKRGMWGGRRGSVGRDLRDCSGLSTWEL